MLKLSKKTTVILIIILIIIGFLVYNSLTKNKEEYEVFEVQKGTVSQTISETGTVKKGEKITLSFQTGGKVEEILKSKGDEVLKGELIAKLDTADLNFQLQEARANLDLARADLSKLLAGASQEEIQLAQTKVDNAKTTLQNEKVDLENVRAEAEEDLDQAYEDAYNDLSDAYLDLYNAYVVIDSIQRTYFIANDQDSIEIQQRSSSIKNDLTEMDNYLQLLEQDFSYSQVESALEFYEQSLSRAKEHLAKIKSITEEPNWRNQISSTDKTSLDTSRSNVIDAFASIVSARQNISSVKITNQTNIATAENAVLTAQDNLKQAEDNLDLVKAEPREEDIKLKQAKIESAQAKVRNLEQKISQASLRAPVDGEIIEKHQSQGEVVTAASPVVDLLPREPLQIEVDIYEEDIVQIDLEDRVKISLVALPDEQFGGRVVFIDPAEKLIEGVVYYEIKIAFDKVPAAIKPGMSADVSVIVEQKEDVLFVVEEAIREEAGQAYVEVLKPDENIEKRKVEIGLEGEEDRVEIKSGLKKGERVIIY